MSTKPAAKSLRSASDAERRGSLGMGDLQRCSEDGLGVQPPSLSGFQRLHIKLRCLAQVGQRLLHCVTLCVATLEFRAIRKHSVLVLFDDSCELASHDDKITGPTQA